MNTKLASAPLSANRHDLGVTTKHEIPLNPPFQRGAGGISYKSGKMTTLTQSARWFLFT
jgi:hypothetical protein